MNAFDAATAAHLRTLRPRAPWTRRTRRVTTWTPRGAALSTIRLGHRQSEMMALLSHDWTPRAALIARGGRIPSEVNQTLAALTRRGLIEVNEVGDARLTSRRGGDPPGV